MVLTSLSLRGGNSLHGADVPVLDGGGTAGDTNVG